MSLLGKSPGRCPLGSTRQLDGIVAEVAARHGVAPEAVRGTLRRKAVFPARIEAIATAYATDNFSMPRLGQYFGYRDHTGVVHVLRAAQRRGLA